MGKHILVTGSHRSGSTWTGRVIAKANNVRYVHEPFNLGDPKLKTPFRYWFSYANGKTAGEQNKIKRYLVSFISNTSSKFLFSIFSKRSLKALYAFAIDFSRRRSYRTVIKDPIALMSADWIYQNLNWDIVVIIRHPAAFIASLKVKNWQFNFKNLQEQSALIEQRLAIFKTPIEEQTIAPGDIIDQGILLWNCMHHVISHYKESYGKDWYFVKHEDLSSDAAGEFQKMFAHLDLTYDQKVATHIVETTQANKDSDFKRDATKNIKNWKNRLTSKEIYRIKKGTYSIWPNFYNESDW